jgi:hypothetical protein
MSRKNESLPTVTITEQLADLLTQRDELHKVIPSPEPKYTLAAPVRTAAAEIKRLGGAGLRKLPAGDVHNYAMQVALPGKYIDLNKTDKIDQLIVHVTSILEQAESEASIARNAPEYLRARFFWSVKNIELVARQEYLETLLKVQDPRSLGYSYAEVLVTASARVRVFAEMALWETERKKADTNDLFTVEEVRDQYVRWLLNRANYNPMSRSTGTLVNLVEDVERSIVAKEMDYGIFAKYSF